MADKLPWFPLYGARFEQDERVRLMTYEEEGLYGALLRHQWANGSIPSDDAALRLMLKPHAPEALTRVKQCFVSVKNDASRLTNSTLAAVRNEQEKKHKRLAKAGRKGGITRGLRARSQASGEASSHGGSLAQAIEKKREEKNRELQQQQPSGAVRRSGKPTWLTPFGEDWHAAVGGKPAYGKLAASLAPLVKEHGEAKVREHWRNYLAETEARFASPAAFAEKFGSFGPDRTARPTAKQLEERRMLQWALEPEDGNG